MRFTHHHQAPLFANVPRFCSLLALGHFTAAILLWLIFVGVPRQTHLLHMIALVSVVALFMMALSFSKSREWVARACFVVLFAETAYLLFITGDLSHPVIMLFPVLFLVSGPVLGTKSPYYLAVLSSAYILCLNFFVFTRHELNWPSLSFRIFGFFIFANLSSFLWSDVLQKEEALQNALSDVKRRAAEMETWVQQLAQAISLIESPSISVGLPDPPPFAAFSALGQNIKEMQDKLGRYFGNIVLRDRLHSVAFLATGLAHELNTPLTTLEFLIASKKDSLPVGTKKEIEEQVGRMAVITREFLSFSSVHQTRQLLDLNALIKEIGSRFDRLKPPRLRIEMKLSERPIRIFATKNEIGQVLMNIFNNAIDATEKEPDPLFCIETGMDDSGRSVLMLQDNGSGVDKTILSKICDPFFTTKAPGRGTGLGLYIVREIVDRHQASLSIESEPGHRTSFRIVFPTTDEQVKTAA